MPLFNSRFSWTLIKQHSVHAIVCAFLFALVVLWQPGRADAVVPCGDLGTFCDGGYNATFDNDPSLDSMFFIKNAELDRWMFNDDSLSAENLNIDIFVPWGTNNVGPVALEGTLDIVGLIDMMIVTLTFEPFNNTYVCTPAECESGNYFTAVKVPTPPSALLFATGLLVLLWFVGRRRRLEPATA